VERDARYLLSGIGAFCFAKMLGRQLHLLTFAPTDGAWFVGSFGIRGFFVSSVHLVPDSTETSAISPTKRLAQMIFGVTL